MREVLIENTYLVRKGARESCFSRSILGGRRVRVVTRRIRPVRGALPLLLIRVAKFPVLVHEVITGELAAADLAGIVLHI